MNSITAIIVTHHTLAEHLIATAAFIAGPNENLIGISISQNDDIEAVRRRLQDMIKKYRKAGRKVLILTDMFGGTPSNICLALYEPGEVEIVSGVNLPILLKLSSDIKGEGKGIREIAAEITEYGRKNIFTAAEFLDL
ncbi:MAG TPA: PTS fructose transporter subunit IIA [Proteobacteria bacterium]|mgnify:CR=1 FL=1|nr:PTS fructose transporter subunit IIA [Deltaproteobacteria bacterium]HDS17186.1 PTS fructose transporter subunit IIA [Pseudomonadota bacterium]